MSRRHRPSKAKAIQNMLGRMGYHARPSDVVAALAEYGIEVSVGMVLKVKMEASTNASGLRRQQALVKRVFPCKQVGRVRKVPRSG